MTDFSTYGAYKFRTVRPDDDSAVKAFTALFVAAHQSPDKTFLGEMDVRDADPTFWRIRFADGHNHGILVCRDNQTCGFMWWVKLEESFGTGYINAHWVEQEHRGVQSGQPYSLGMGLLLYTMQEMECAGCKLYKGAAHVDNQRLLDRACNDLGFAASWRPGTSAFLTLYRAANAPTPILDKRTVPAALVEPSKRRFLGWFRR